MAYEQQGRYFRKSADSSNFEESAQMNLKTKYFTAYTAAFTIPGPPYCMCDAFT